MNFAEEGRTFTSLRIAVEIFRDLDDRSGCSMDGVAEDTRREIVNDWATIIQRYL